jgi:hypothetical protein
LLRIGPNFGGAHPFAGRFGLYGASTETQGRPTMIRLQGSPPTTVEEAQSQLQQAIAVEFGTIPPYLYAMFSIPPGRNVAAAQLIKSVLLQEMIHMCLACNILNAIRGTPKLVPPVYPGTLGDIGPDGQVLTVRLLRFSTDSMDQGMKIEQPEKKPHIPVVGLEAVQADKAMSIAEFYAALDAFLATLDPQKDWAPNRHQITDNQFFPGQLFAVNGYPDAHRAISIIVSEGEGAKDNPLDFEAELSHYYRFAECYNNKVLTKVPGDPGYQFGPESLGIDWDDVFPCIPDPGLHDFANEPAAAQKAQAECNAAYSRMVDALQLAVTGQPAQLGIAVRAMFDLRLATQVALRTPLNDPATVAGPAFLYVPSQQGASS